MIFKSLWPLLFLIAVPLIIILYLLKPKGVDYRISSGLLWERLLKNQHSKTFFEKFVHNILMYLQILIVLFLILSFMSPYVNVESKQGGRVIFLIDTSASMQHDNGSGITRLEEAVQLACDYVDTSRNTTFSIVTADSAGTELLAVGMGDKSSIKQILRDIKASDASGALSDAQTMVETLCTQIDENGEGETAQIIVLTDGNSAQEALFYTEHMSAELVVTGKPVSNLANEFTAYSTTDSGTDVVTRVTNYGLVPAVFEVSLYAGDDMLLAVQPLSLQAGETSMCLFQNVAWDETAGEPGSPEVSYLKTEITASAEQDSLQTDNISYAVRSGSSIADGVLIGRGNTFIERAYLAVAGSDIARVEQEPEFSGENYNLAIYDIGNEPSDITMVNRMRFAGTSYTSGALQNVRLEAAAGELTAGLSDFTFGANQTYTYVLPEWAHSFMTSNGQCVAYYGEHDGIREIVLGFDLRETNFPLMAEFPVFMANAIAYLSDTSVLSSNSYTAGEEIVWNPRSDIDISTINADTSKAGIYYIEAGEEKEYYTVRMETERESDGLLTAENITGTKDYSNLKVRQNLKNIFLVLAFLLLILEWFLYLRQMNRLKHPNRFYLAIRCIGLLLVVLAIIGFSIPRYSNRTTTIFVIDMSESNRENLDGIERYLSDKIAEMPKDNQYGIVTFGRDAQIEQFLTDRNMVADLMTVPDATATNLEEAVYRAMAMIPTDCTGRLVLLTDGCETCGNIMNTVSAVVANDIEMEGILYESVRGQDAYLNSVKLPSYLHPGDSYSVEVTVTANYDTDAEISFMNGEEVLLTTPVHLNKGSNRFVMEQMVSGETMESFQVVVNAPGDTCAENDSYHAYAIVEAAPRMLLIAGTGENTSVLSEILTQAGCDFDVVTAKNAPGDLSAILGYKNIILQNVYLGDLPEGFLEVVGSYVKDYGGGLVCCGGEDSFALGGYRESILEEILPVDMMLRGVDELPSTAMVMVVDRSGSMLSGTPSNLDMAITAVVEAVNQIFPEDYVGVLSFDTENNWEVEITQALDKEEIIEQVQRITEGGGTEIKPALEEAYREIMNCDVSVRHVVLLTDGMGETMNFDDVIADYQDGAVTLSTVAVGFESDQNLLRRLAQSCGGRYYYTDDSTEIPRIFTQEVFLSGDTYLQNGDFTLQINTGHEITNGLFEEGWPVLHGYVSSSPKSTSNVLIASDKQDPVLTVWQYGLGKTVAWNTDVTNKWTGEFAGEEDYIQLWRRIVDYSSGNTSLGEDDLSVVSLADQTTITYEAKEYTGQTTVEAVYQGPDGETGAVTLHAVAPGKYETQVDTFRQGIYQISVRRLEAGEIVNAVTTARAVQFSDEYRFDVSNANVTSFLENYGMLLTEEDILWKKRSTAAKESYDLTNWMLALTILLFLLDIAVRRFQYVPVIGRRKAQAGRKEKVIAETDSKITSGVEEANQESVVPVKEVSTEQVKQEKDKDVKRKKKEKHAGHSKKKKTEEQPEVLDTSQLLKKKNDRNIT